MKKYIQNGQERDKAEISNDGNVNCKLRVMEDEKNKLFNKERDFILMNRAF